jgi:hypothetical protein
MTVATEAFLVPSNGRNMKYVSILLCSERTLPAMVDKEFV